VNRIARRIKRDLILTALLSLGAIVAYHVLLDEEARSGVRAMNHTIIDSFNTLSEMVDDRIGTIMDDEVVAQNRQNIKDAWKALGF
jgi:hypothetical protein